MASLKVVVPLLSKRMFPVENTADKSNVIGSVKLGFQFESVGQISNTLGIWYQDRDGYYYWGGGVEEVAIVDDFPMIENYNSIFTQIPIKFRKTKGAGIKVAILDSGIIEHRSLKGAVFNCIDKSESEFGYVDQIGHGTHCAGIIGARSFGLTGIAPESELYIAKVMDDNGFFSCKNVLEGLRWAIEDQHVDVINCSFGLDDNVSTELSLFLEDAEKKNVIIVAAAGENLILTDKYNGFLNPAMLKNCFAVGAINLYNSIQSFRFHPSLDIIMPNNKIVSCGKENDSFISDHGSSMSTAFLSGIISLIISYYRESENKTVNLSDIKREVNSFSYEFTNTINFSNSYQLIKCIQ
jgi:subtilisin family serine protease